MESVSSVLHPTMIPKIFPGPTTPLPEIRTKSPILNPFTVLLQVLGILPKRKWPSAPFNEHSIIAQFVDIVVLNLQHEPNLALESQTIEVAPFSGFHQITDSDHC